uniref:Uncharacterized protein n=1 Tax=Klebsiella pneumoniae TaxID=573 RepID=A0A2P1BNI4_KLEPN|nr:hypothetical protein [Klebsiella pneumoniae]
MFINRLEVSKQVCLQSGNNMRGIDVFIKRMLMLCYRENSKHSQSLRHISALQTQSGALLSIF